MLFDVRGAARPRARFNYGQCQWEVVNNITASAMQVMFSSAAECFLPSKITIYEDAEFCSANFQCGERLSNEKSVATISIVIQDSKSTAAKKADTPSTSEEKFP